MEYTGCRALTVEECDKILRAFAGRHAARDRALFLLGIHTGYRIGEMLSLRVCDVWDGTAVRPTITVRRAFMKGKARSRTMPLHARARVQIESWLRILGVERPDQHLFPRQQSSIAMTPHRFYGLIRSAANRAGLSVDRIGTHTMRKTFASRMWTSRYVNQDMARMARLLGHQNWSNTLRYIEFLDDSLRCAILEP